MRDMAAIFCALPLLTLASSAGLSQTPTATPPAAQRPPCASIEHRQFDFWVGDWDVYPTGKDAQVATSKIERLYGGCVIRENWMPLKGAPGGSINSYDGADKIWRQTWADAGNSWVEFKGGFADGAMVLTGSWRGSGAKGTDALTRMTYTKDMSGAVRQFGEQSSDGGKTWSASFDFNYRPKSIVK